MELIRRSAPVPLVAAVEAILFAAGEPLEAEALAQALRRAGVEVEAGGVEEAVEALRARYAQQQSALSVERWAGGYRLATHPDYAPYVEAARVEERAVRLSGALLETAAVVAYKQPVTKPEVDFVRGVDSAYALARLAEYGLVETVGQSDSVGRPLLYGTTPFFLETFGLDSLEGLPSLREIEELLGDPAFSRERARLLTLRQMDDALSPDDGARAASTPDRDAFSPPAE